MRVQTLYPITYGSSGAEPPNGKVASTYALGPVTGSSNELRITLIAARQRYNSEFSVASLRLMR